MSGRNGIVKREATNNQIKQNLEFSSKRKNNQKSMRMKIEILFATSIGKVGILSP